MQSPVLNTIYYDWLQAFLSFLREKRFAISPDTHIRLIQVLEKNAGRITGDNLLDYISPVVVKNAEQSQQLRQAYAEFLEKQFPLIPDTSTGSFVKEPGKKKFGKMIGWALLIVAVGTAILLIRPFNNHPAPGKAMASFSIPSTLFLHSVLLLDASHGLTALSDTQYVRFIWNTGDGTIDSSGYQIKYLYKKPGAYSISLKLRALSEEISVSKADTAASLQVCSFMTYIRIGDQPMEIGQTIDFKLIYDSLYPPSKDNTWTVNGKPALKNSFLFSHTFDSAGTYTVRLHENDTAGNKCAIDNSREITISDPKRLALDISSKKSVPPEMGVSLNGFWQQLLLLGVLLPLVLLAWLQWNLKRKEKISRAKAGKIIDQFHGEGEPVEIPFRNHDELINDEKELLEVARSYKQRNTDLSNYLNISETIASTIRAEGFLQPVWSNKTKPVEYLMLIDKSKVKSQQVKLFEYLLKRFSRNEVYLEKFYFLFDPDVCTNSAFPGGILLSSLHGLFPNHTVIILGTGYQLIDTLYPSLKASLVQLFRKWENWAICTPVSMADWDYREKILQKATFLFPADLRGQLLLFKVLRGETHYTEELSKLEAYPAKQVDMEDASDLEKYLDDPYLFQWLCAIAVYPRIQWDVMVSIGKALQAANYPEKEVSYSTLLKIVRIRWLQEGSFPDHTRLELLKRLEPRNEKLARETMIRLMDEAARKVGDNSFSFEELQMQRITDKFLLYTHDPDKTEYQNYKTAQGEFKTLWEQGLILDTPLSDYLKKDGRKDTWTTLIRNKNLNDQQGAGIPMNVFFKEGVHLKKKRTYKAAIALSCISLLSALLLFTGFLAAKLISNTTVDRFLQLTHTESNLPFIFRLALNDCLSRKQMRADSTRFVFIFPGNQQLELNSGDTALSFPTSYLFSTDSMVKMTLRSKDADFNLDTSFRISGAEMVFGMTGCPLIVPSCGKWVLNNKMLLNADAKSEAFLFFDVSIKSGSLPSYRSISLSINKGELGSIDGKEIREWYQCKEDSTRAKIIMQNADKTFQVAYLKSTILEENTDKQGSLRFALTENSFRSLTEARNDTSKPVFLNKLSIPGFKYFEESGGTENLIPYQGNWINKKDTLAINTDIPLNAINKTTLYGGTIRILYNKKQWNIKELLINNKSNLVFYKALLTSVQRPSETAYLLFCIVNNSKILVNEKMYTPMEMENEEETSGTFLTYTRNASVQQRKNVPSIATVSEDTTAKILKAVSQNWISDLKGHSDGVTGAAFSPDGKKIVTSSKDNTAKIWDTGSGNLIADFKSHSGEVYSAVFSPDGRKIITASEDNTAEIWDVGSGKFIADLKGHSGYVCSAAFSPDGKKILTASEDSTVKIWDAASGKLIFILKSHFGGVTGAAFSPDGRKIVSASEDGTAKIWEAATGKLMANLKGHSDGLTGAAFSPDGKKIVTSSTDNTAKIWEAGSGKLIAGLKGHSDVVYSAVFSPDGKKIVTASADKTAKIWDAGSGNLIVDLKGHSDVVYTAVFSPDGNRIVTASNDKTAKIWNADSGN